MICQWTTEIDLQAWGSLIFTWASLQ